MLLGMTRSPSDVMLAGHVCLHPAQPLERIVLVLLQMVFSKAFQHKSSLLSSKYLYETFKEKGKQKCFVGSVPKWIEMGGCYQTGLKLLYL